MALDSFLYAFQHKVRQRAIALYYSVIKPKRADIYNGEYKPKSVLFILCGLIGDSVMSQPAIAVAREVWPEAKITVLAKSHNRDLLMADPAIDSFYVCDADPFSLRRSAETRRLKDWLASQGFDMAIILLGDQYAHLLAEAGIPIRVGVKGTILEPCLTHVYEIGSPREWRHIERLNSLRVLGMEVSDRLPKLYVDAKAAEMAEKKLAEAGCRPGLPYVAFHPFGSTQRQWWPAENVSEFLMRMERQNDRQIVLVGGSETKSAEIGNARIIDMRGRLSLPELLAVINAADLVITTDSGPYHIAGALGKKIVGLFRNRRPEHAANYPTAKVIFGKNQECEKRCDWDRCRSIPCKQMADIDSGAVCLTISEERER